MILSMRASTPSVSHVASCSHFNESSASWGHDGVAIDSMTTAGGSGQSADSQVVIQISCVSYHLSEFAVSTSDDEHIFAPVDVVRTHEMPVDSNARKLDFPYSCELHSVTHAHTNIGLCVES